jgi:glyoxylase-like metal-dependent hydrolase (beta-lactamase superfamily II)
VKAACALRAGRRQALQALGALVLAACASPSSSTLRTSVLAPGVYLLPGSGGGADENNLGRIGNAGFVVGDAGVIVIDTGTSLAHGREILRAIKAVTDKPVKLALVTHTRPEFLFGGAAFKEAGIPIRMHRRTATLMASRCETCLRTLRQVVGVGPIAGTTLYQADQTFDAAHTLREAGRAVSVLYFGHSSGPGDIAVRDDASGVVFAGGLLDAQRVPDIQDADLEGWKRALRSLRESAPNLLVPGHGPASPPALIATVEGYLAQLETKLRSLVRSGVSLLDIADAGELPQYANWDQYDTIHRRNASVAYLRFERELLFK